MKLNMLDGPKKLQLTFDTKHLFLYATSQMYFRGPN